MFRSLLCTHTHTHTHTNTHTHHIQTTFNTEKSEALVSSGDAFGPKLDIAPSGNSSAPTGGGPTLPGSNANSFCRESSTIVHNGTQGVDFLRKTARLRFSKAMSTGCWGTATMATDDTEKCCRTGRTPGGGTA